MAELANCPNCGEVFVKSIRNICQECFYEEEKAFETVYRYIRQKKNREATITEISEATGVEEQLIIKFIKENRIRAVNFPNLNYPCERCHQPIAQGRLCQSCSDGLKHDLKREEEWQREQSEKNHHVTYHAYKDRTDK